MNITSCPQCGGRVRSVSIGWKCEGCNGFIDMSGQFHEHKDELFMPPMANADRIRAMSDEELVDWIINKAPQIASYYSDSKLGLLDWIKRPAGEDT